MVQGRNGGSANLRWPHRNCPGDSRASGSSWSSNKHSRAVAWTPSCKPAKQGWEPREPRLEIGNSASWCYSSSPRDHDSREQPKKKTNPKPHQMGRVELDTPPRKALRCSGVSFGQRSRRLRQDTPAEKPRWVPPYHT